MKLALAVISFYTPRVSLDPLSRSEPLDRFLAAMGVDCGVLPDPYKLAEKKFGVMDKDGGGSIPRTFVFAPDGQLIGDVNGKPEDLTGWLKAAVRAGT